MLASLGTIQGCFAICAVLGGHGGRGFLGGQNGLVGVSIAGDNGPLLLRLCIASELGVG